MEQRYCENITGYTRRKSRVVAIGDVSLGGSHPIRIQSMTTTPTMDTEATVAESIRIIEAGADYVRITAPNKREAENLAEIKRELRDRGYSAPLIADIHYTPNAALVAAEIVEKVRINPGNYADKKKFRIIEYSDESYNEELQRIEDRFSPLVKVCRERGVAMRIGTNHGSLSDRIMSRYGDTPLGMVESALEFLRICGKFDYHDIVLSMKSSNPVVMVQAYRLLVQRMDLENMDYPLHLGVTEAGEGEDGRIKSALGIGTLLEDGLGDTIRVSLTELPENEIPVAKRIVSRYENPAVDAPAEYTLPYDPFSYTKRRTNASGNIGGDNVPAVICGFGGRTPGYEDFRSAGHVFDSESGTWKRDDTSADYIYCGSALPECEIPPDTGLILNYESWINNGKPAGTYPLISSGDRVNEVDLDGVLNFRLISLSDFSVADLKIPDNSVLILEGKPGSSFKTFRSSIIDLLNNRIEFPVVIALDFSQEEPEFTQVNGAIDLAGPMIDGLGDGVFLKNTGENDIGIVFNILQSGRFRIFKTEFISCPSCGRTHFDLKETSAKIRERTGHLKGLKLGIMGCIVNGPGEMADADFGYVGTAPGRVALYRGKEMVKKDIPEGDAVDELINLIKTEGRWIEREP